MAIEVGAAYLSILPETSKIAPGVRQAFGDAERSAGRVGGKAGGGFATGLIKSAGKALGGTAIAAIGTTAGVAITKGFNRAIQLQEAEAKLSGLGNSSKDVAKIMENALAAVKGTAFGMGDAATVAASAVAAGIKPGKDLERNLTLVGDAATIAGVGMGEMGAIFNKVAASNKLQMDVINQLHDAGVPALQLVAQEMGVTAEEASKMASAGKVDFATFQRAMEAGLGGAAQKSGETFRGSLANMGAALGRLGVGFANPLVVGAPVLFSAITAAIDSLGGVVGPVAERFGNALVPALERGAEAVGKVGPAIEGLQALLGKGDYTDGLRKSLGLEESSGVVGALLEARGGVIALTQAFRDGGTDLTSSGFAGMLESIGLTARQLWDAIGPAAQQLAPAVWQVVSAFSPLGLIFKILAPVLPVLAKALGDVVAALSGALAGAAPAIAVVATALAGIVVGAVQLIAPLLACEGLVKGLVFAFLAWRTASIVATAAQWALNAAMSANPIGLAIVAIAALVAGLVWFFTQTEAGQKIVQTVWGGIKTAIGAVVDWFQGTAWPVIKAAWDGIVDAFQTAWRWIKPVWDGIVTAAKGAWTVLKVVFVAIATGFSLAWKAVSAIWTVTGKPLFDVIVQAAKWLGERVAATWANIRHAIGVAWNWINRNVIIPFRIGVAVLGAVFRMLWRTYVVPAWNGIKSAISSAWTWIKAHIFNPLADGIMAIGRFFRELWMRYVLPAWGGIKSAARDAWGWIRDRVFSPLKRGVTAIGDAFKKVKDVIKTAWDKIKSAAAKPVNFIIETVYTKGIKKTWDDIADAVGLDLKLPTISPLKYASGGVLPGYTPGRDVHHFTSPTGGRLSLSGGEAIMRPEFTRAVGGPAGVARLNAMARKGQAFKNGGVFGDAWEKIKDVGSSFLSGPAGLIKKVISGPANELLRNIGGGTLGKIAGQLPKKVIEALIGKAKDFASTMFSGDQALSGGGKPAGPALGWQAMWSVVKSAFPGASLNSAFRPGAITAVGTPSYHGQGRAIDVTPSMSIFNWLAKHFPNSRELIYSPAGGRQIWNGRNYQFGEPTRGDHWDHVHWAMANGGVWSGLFDQGGWLPNKGVGLNLTGQPEAVLTPAESKALKAGVISATAEARRYVREGSRRERQRVTLQVGRREFEAYMTEVAEDAIEANDGFNDTTRRMR